MGVSTMDTVFKTIFILFFVYPLLSFLVPVGGWAKRNALAIVWLVSTVQAVRLYWTVVSIVVKAFDSMVIVFIGHRKGVISGWRMAKKDGVALFNFFGHLSFFSKPPNLGVRLQARPPSEGTNGHVIDGRPDEA